jgi:hypothetical protein
MCAALQGEADFGHVPSYLAAGPLTSPGEGVIVLPGQGERNPQGLHHRVSASPFWSVDFEERISKLPGRALNNAGCFLDAEWTFLCIIVANCITLVGRGLEGLHVWAGNHIEDAQMLQDIR